MGSDTTLVGSETTFSTPDVGSETTFLTPAASCDRPPGKVVSDPTSAAGVEKVVSDPTSRRIRWRCRRGLLENDIILARFLDARAGTLDDADVAMLDRLLDLPDNDLWDLIAGRVEPADPSVRPLLHELRAL